MSTIMVGESLVGEGNEVAHIDLMIGRKDGPVGFAFAIEKSFTPGRARLEAHGWNVKSLVNIASIEDGAVRFAEADD